MSRGDPRPFVVTGSVSGKLEHLGGDVLKDGCKVYWGVCADSGASNCLFHGSMHASNWELETSSGGARVRNSSSVGSTFVGHDDRWL